MSRMSSFTRREESATVPSCPSLFTDRPRRRLDSLAPKIPAMKVRRLGARGADADEVGIGGRRQ